LEFAKWALGELQLPPRAVIIDPWNGSGTTAAACALLGYSFQGYDINPVMVHLGRARVASSTDFHEAEELIRAVEGIIGRAPQTTLHHLGSAFRQLPVTNEAAHSIAIAALFPFARNLLKAARTKNPSWFKKGVTLDSKVLPKAEVMEEWRILLKEIHLWRSMREDSSGTTIAVERGDSRKTLGRKEAFDGVLTSPPYLTRLDYVQATLPEILLLKEFDTVPDIQRLRRSMIGSPLTSERTHKSLDQLPKDIKKLLSKIENHASKASSSYYYRFFSSYFVDLQVSIRNLSKVLNKGASGCLVVQPSHYKEIEVNLTSAIISLGDECGLRHHSTVEFDVRRSMSIVNSRAHKNARAPKNESAVFFRKE
jgi:hypothetical protein